MTHLRRPLLGLLFLGSLALTTRAAEVEPLLPAETEGVMFVNVRQILESELVKEYALGQMKQALEGADAQKMMKQLGLDPLKDIDRATIGTWGDDPIDMKVFGVIRGNFDPAKLFEASQKAAKDEADRVSIVTEGKYKLVKFTPEDEFQPPFYFAVADEKAVVMANEAKLVTNALDAVASGAKPAVKKELQALILTMDEKASMFLCGLTDGKVGDIPPINLPGVDGDKLADQLKDMRSLSMTLRLTQDINFEIGMGMKDANSADDFGGTVDNLIGTAKAFLPLLAAQAPQAQPLVNEVTKTLRTRVKDKQVVVSMKVTADSLSGLAGGFDE